MVELGVDDGFILQVELRLSVCEPGFATFWPEHRKLHSNSIYMTRRDRKLASDISGQTWISRHCFHPETINCQTYNFAYCGSLWKQQGGRLAFQPKCSEININSKSLSLDV